MLNKAEQIWQFLSTGDRKDILDTSDIDDLYNDDILDNDKLEKISKMDYQELEYQYRHYLDLCTPHIYSELSKQEDWKDFLKHQYQN